jgi:tRNA(Met) C34 N-acetyltransferase TmcA
MELAYELRLDVVEQALEHFVDHEVPGGDGPIETEGEREEVHHALASEAFRQLDEWLGDLRHPVEPNAVRNFVAKLMKACTRSLTKDDAEYLEQLARLVMRLRPSAGVLDAALAALFAASDGSPPAPSDVHAAVVHAQSRVEEVGRRIDEIRRRVGG